MKLRAFVLMIVLIVIIYAMTGCNQTDEETDQYSIGIICTNEYRGNSVILGYEDDLNCVLKRKLKGLNAELSEGVSGRDGELFVRINGSSDRLDYGKVIALDPLSLNGEEFDFHRINMTDLAYSDGALYVLSNCNWEFFIDRVDINSHAKESIVIDDCIVMDFTVADHNIYAIIQNENGEIYLARYTMENNLPELLISLSHTEPKGYYDVACTDEKVMVLFDNCVYSYDITGGSVCSTQLTRSDANRFYLQRGKVFVICTDPLSESSESAIMGYDPLMGKELDSLIYNGVISQLCMREDEDRVYLLDEYDLVILQQEKGKLIEVKRQTVDIDDGYCGGMFVL